MNIFGHAWVASSIEADPGFVLGSMLPDLEQLVGSPAVRADDPVVTRGVACHHTTDAVFHGSEAFGSLSGAARRWLGEAGVRRGPTLAVAHVGVELLIDGFIEDRATLRLFEDALRMPANVRWPNDESHRRFEYVRERIAEANIPHAYRDDDEVAYRLVRMLSRRPRLAVTEAEHPVVRRWLTHARPLVEAAMPSLAGQLIGA